MNSCQPTNHMALLTWLADSNREIDFFVDQIDQTIGQIDVDVYVGILCKESANSRR